MALFQRDIAVDQTTLAGELQRTEKLDLVGGMAYLSHLVAITPTSAHAEDYAQAISRTSTMRRLIDAGSKIVDLGYSDTDDLEKTMRVAEDALFAVRGAGQFRGFVSLRDIYDQYLQDQADMSDPLQTNGLPIMTGFPDLDEYLGGLQRADLVILGARPSMGKSSLAVNMAINAAKTGQVCGVFSLEMTREQLAMRILASEANLDSHRLRLGLYTQHEEARIIDSIGRLSDLPVFIDDTPYQGVAVPRQLDLPVWRRLVLPVHLRGLAAFLGHTRAVAGHVKLQDHGMMHHPVDGRGGGHGVGEYALPLREDQVRGYAQRPSFVAFGDEGE